MPFFFALPRPATFSGQVQSGSMAKSDYIRTAPSSLMYDMASGYLYPIKMMLYKSLSVVSAAMDNANTSGESTVPFHKEAVFYMSPYKMDRCHPITLPGVEISLSGRPDPSVISVIESAGGEAKRIKGQVKDIYHVVPKDYNALSDLMGIEQAATEYRPTEGNISIIQIPSLVLLITRIHYIASLLYALSPFGSVNVSVDFNGTLKSTVSVPMSTEEGSIEETPTSKEQTMTVVMDEHIPISSITFTNKSSEPYQVFSSANNVPTSSGGIFLPFESSYAEFDIQIIHQFLYAFRSVIFVDVLEWSDSAHFISQHWTGGIARSKTGLYMAHMMKALLLALEAGTAVRFISRPDGVYQGAILLGELIQIRLVGKLWYQAMPADKLREDIALCGAHALSVKKIIEVAGLVGSTVEQFGSLRALSQAVNVGGRPSGAAMNTIMKELPNVAFEERMDSINLDTLKDTLDLLTSDRFIPEDLYMDKGFFFAKDRFEEVLCRFGNTAPSFCPGGQTEIRCCGVLGRGVPDSLKYDRASPPSYLQSTRVTVAVCATQWRDLLQHGHLRGVFDRRVTGTRVWAGKDAKEIWSMLDDYCRKIIIEKGVQNQPSQVQESGGSKRARDEDLELADRKKKLLRFF